MIGFAILVLGLILFEYITTDYDYYEDFDGWENYGNYDRYRDWKDYL